MLPWLWAVLYIGPSTIQLRATVKVTQGGLLIMSDHCPTTCVGLPSTSHTFLPVICLYLLSSSSALCNGLPPMLIIHATCACCQAEARQWYPHPTPYCNSCLTVIRLQSQPHPGHSDGFLPSIARYQSTTIISRDILCCHIHMKAKKLSTPMMHNYGATCVGRH